VVQASRDRGSIRTPGGVRHEEEGKALTRESGITKTASAAPLRDKPPGA